MITAGVHGDEQNGIMTAMKVAQRLVEQDIAGCVTIVPTINVSGILNHSRNFFPVDPDASPSNLNRFFPGNVEGNEVERYLERYGTTYYCQTLILRSTCTHKPQGRAIHSIFSQITELKKQNIWRLL